MNIATTQKYQHDTDDTSIDHGGNGNDSSNKNISNMGLATASATCHGRSSDSGNDNRKDTDAHIGIDNKYSSNVMG
jgi:hypothetical protein